MVGFRGTALRGALVVVALYSVVPPLAAAEPEPRIEVEPREGTIGDAFVATLTVTLPEETKLERPTLGPKLGRFSVLDGGWLEPDATGDGGRTEVWQGHIAAFEPGELELPAIALRIDEVDGSSRTLRTEPVPITIRSVLDPDGPAELADLKEPASLAPNFGAMRIAIAILALLLIGAGLLWWLQRRYAGRFAAVPPPDDPFHRVDPHVWVYRELQQLLERRLPEQGQIDPFYAELSRILKLYLGGRFRVDLLERTTEELPDLLRQAGAPQAAAADARALLLECDRVKFAGERPTSTRWREVVERVYSIADSTKPSVPADQGAA